MAEYAALGVGTRWPGRAAAKWLAGAFLAERERWPLWLPVLFGAGIGLYFAAPSEPPVWLGGFAAGLLLLTCLGARQSTYWLLAGIAAAVVAAGFGAAQLRARMVAAPILAERYGPAPVIGQVVALERLDSGPRVILEDVRLRGVAPEHTPMRVRIRLHRSDSVTVGQRIDVFARLVPPRPPVMPGAYDFQRAAWFRGIGATGFALAPARVAAQAAALGEVSTWSLRLAALRQAMADRIRASLPGEAGAVAAALVTGDRSAIGQDTMDAMRDSGLAHLLAISGLHMGLVAATLFFGLRALMALFETLALRHPIKKWAAAAALAGGLFYLLLAGATVPTQRAFVTTGLILAAVVFDREAISLRLVAWAAMIVLLVAPESLTGASFQMSFAAVVALVAFYETGRGRLSGWLGRGGPARRVALYAAGVAMTTVIASLATGIIGLHHFGRVAAYGLPANMLAVPLTALWIMPWAVVSVILMPFGLEAWALAPMGWGIEAVLAVARSVSSWPGAVHPIAAMPLAGLSLVALGGLWLCLWRGRWRLWGIAGIVAGLASVPMTPGPDVLVSESGKLMAVRLDDGRLGLSNERIERFSGRVWLEHNGQKDRIFWTNGAAASGTPLACDRLGCIYRKGGETVALVEDGRALAEDCRSATVLISRIPVRTRCPAPRVVIDRFDLWRHGAHALWLSDGQVRVKTVAAWQGDRPWSAWPVD